MRSRRLTVSCSHRESRAARPRCVSLAPVPLLRLRGRWLDAAGFPIGTPVKVVVSIGRLVVEALDVEARR